MSLNPSLYFEFTVDLNSVYFSIILGSRVRSSSLLDPIAFFIKSQSIFFLKPSPLHSMTDQKTAEIAQAALEILKSQFNKKFINYNFPQNLLHEAALAATRIHQFTCPDCGRQFSRMYNLKSHIKTHKDIRPFQCPHCELAFSRNHDLTRHVKTHSTLRPHVCSSCGRSFARRDALLRHERIKTEGKKLHCVPRQESIPPSIQVEEEQEDDDDDESVDLEKVSMHMRAVLEQEAALDFLNPNSGKRFQDVFDEEFIMKMSLHIASL